MEVLFIERIEQANSAKYLNDVVAFSKKATKRKEVTSREMSKRITTKKRLTKDAVAIESLKIQL